MTPTTKVVATEIAAAAAVGGSISGAEIAALHNLDRGDVARAIRILLRNGLIRPAREDVAGGE